MLVAVALWIWRFEPRRDPIIVVVRVEVIGSCVQVGVLSWRCNLSKHRPDEAGRDCNPGRPHRAENERAGHSKLTSSACSAEGPVAHRAAACPSTSSAFVGRWTVAPSVREWLSSPPMRSSKV